MSEIRDSVVSQADVLRSLRERVEGASGGDRELDADMSSALLDSQVKRKRELLPSYVHHFGDGEWVLIPAYTASLDAALGLVERCLPGWEWILGRHNTKAGERSGTRFRGTLIQPGGELTACWGHTPALALLSALLSALPAPPQ
jgi:hypothetical protein